MALHMESPHAAWKVNDQAPHAENVAPDEYGALAFEISDSDLQQIAKYRPTLEAYRAARNRDVGFAAANNVMLGKPFRRKAD